MIHDAQMDYYAKRLATCSSDATIKIFEVTAEAQRHVSDLLGHEGPIWQLAWAHPKFGSVLASCGYDRKVIVWREQEGAKNQWTKVHVFAGHELSVNSIAFAPHEFGLMLACGSSDGQISILICNSDGSWTSDTFVAHHLGVNAVSWAPFSAAGALLSSSVQSESPRLVSGGCDAKIKIWSISSPSAIGNANPHQAQQQQGQQQIQQKIASLEHTLEEHTDWVRDVQWAPNIGLPSNAIASASQDGKVIIWTQDITDGKSAWQKHSLDSFNETVWRVSWSLTGNILAVTSGDSRVTLWKEGLDHQWKCIASPEDPSKSN
jgi:protein transport protein SEC13